MLFVCVPPPHLPVCHGEGDPRGDTGGLRVHLKNLQVAARPLQFLTVCVQVEHLPCVVVTAVGRGGLLVIEATPCCPSKTSLLEML